MPRCRKEHDYPEWKAWEFNSKYYTTGGSRYIEISEAVLKIKEEAWIKSGREDFMGNFVFHSIHWERKCKKCGKVMMEYLDPDQRPKPDKKVKVKNINTNKVERESKHGRKLGGYKEEKMSPGSQHW